MVILTIIYLLYYCYSDLFKISLVKLEDGSVAFTFTNKKNRAKLVGNIDDLVVYGMVGGGGNSLCNCFIIIVLATGHTNDWSLQRQMAH